MFKLPQKLFQLAPSDNANVLLLGGGGATRLSVPSDGTPASVAGPGDGSSAVLMVNKTSAGRNLNITCELVPLPTQLTPTTTDQPWTAASAGVQEFMVKAPEGATSLEVSATTVTSGALTDLGLGDTWGTGFGGTSYDGDTLTANGELEPGTICRIHLQTNQATSGTLSVVFKDADGNAIGTPSTAPAAT